MSESTFRAVVASVLIGALVLAIVVAVALLPKPTTPQPTPAASPTASRLTPSPDATPAGPAFGEPSVVSVGLVARGTSSALTFRLELAEAREGAISDGPGSFEIVLADSDGSESTIAFTGTPTISAPGSLGITVTLEAPNVLRLTIIASDTLNIEPISITGLGIRSSSTAALGPVAAEIRDTTGSLSMPFAGPALPSPATIVAGM